MVPASAISLAIRGSATFAGGPTWPLLCDAIGNAVSAWAVVPGNILILGVTNGVIGAGTVTGLLQITGPASIMAETLTSGGLVGATASQLGLAIGLGLISSLSGQLTYVGVSTGVGSGIDLSAVTQANAYTLAPILRLNHAPLTAGFGGSGAQLPAFYDAISVGIAAMLLTGMTVPGSGVVVPSGPLGPGGSVGTSLNTVS